MTGTATQSRAAGFTLIELLIVIVIIAILALMVVPRLMGAVRNAREASMRDNLYNLRTAVSQFFSDTGMLPGTLSDLVAEEEASISVDVPPNSYKGPYLRAPGGIGGSAIPRNPFVPASETDISAHWSYDSSDGGVTVADSFKTGEWRTYMDGVLYEDL